MTTSSKELAAEFNNVTGTIAQIRDDYRLPCPNGYVCEGVKQADCNEVRALFNDTKRLGLGDIFAGVWCPVDNNTMRNCPIGNYCPDPRTVVPCPKGMFCPHKVRKNAVCLVKGAFVSLREAYICSSVTFYLIINVNRL